MDLKYVQNVQLGKRYNAQIDIDFFNVFNSQTGYSIQNQFHLANYSTPRTFFDPRRFQMAFKVQF